MKLEPKVVSDIIKSCLYKEDEIKGGGGGYTIPLEGAVMVQGVMAKFGFHPDRIKEAMPQIKELLEELPSTFKQSGGGGWSFLNACMDKNGRQWGEHRDIDELICLGLATGLVEFSMPRDMWEALPGGMPYFVVKV